MSHQTVIAASPELKTFFANCRDGRIRMINIGIENGQLILLQSGNSSGTWKDDYDATVLPYLEEKQPCYVLYRLDRATQQEYDWLLISYVPASAPVLQKKLYEDAKATLMQEFGDDQIKEELFGTAKEDVCLQGYLKDVQNGHKQRPLNIGATQTEKASTLPGVSFPIEDEAIASLINIGAKTQINYLQLKIDVDSEEILLASYDTIKANEVSSRIPSDVPRYHFYIYAHTHEGEYLESIIFIYSMPGYMCSVKERMLYSSCKATLLSGCEDVLKMEISKMVEVSDPAEVTEEFIYEELHPNKDIVRPEFGRPNAPR